MVCAKDILLLNVGEIFRLTHYGAPNVQRNIGKQTLQNVIPGVVGFFYIRYDPRNLILESYKRTVHVIKRYDGIRQGVNDRMPCVEQRRHEIKRGI
ncbi:MAG: hypothetical protein LBH54_04410 [Clostridiales bacterium]|nr:hypothetical protein [Clostridiales bacterium]